MPNFVQLYKSTDLNAPVLTGQTGSMVSLLDAILVNGYTTASVTSITRSGSTVTVTLAAANTTMVTGNQFLISGAVETNYNGVWPITVVSSTVFTFNIGVLTPTSPATGTILYRKAPLAWAKAYSGTNKAAYRSADTASNRFYLRVLDTGATTGGAKEAAVWAAESMSDVDTGTNLFPTSAQMTNGLCWTKSSTADATARDWTLVGDDKTFHLIVSATNTAATSFLYSFGHFNTFKSGDGFNTFIAGPVTFNSASPSQYGLTGCVLLANYQSASPGIYVARSYTQTGGSINPGHVVPGMPSGTVGASALIAYPNSVDNGLYVAAMHLVESATGAPFRGRIPGIYAPMHQTPLNNYDVATNVVGLTGASLIALTASNSSGTGQVFIDTVGPW